MHRAGSPAYDLRMIQIILTSVMTLLLPIATCVATPGLPDARQDAAAVDEAANPEAPILTNQVQLTFSDRFVKAGESYFSPDDSRVIFQAVEVPPEGEPADEFYGMYVGDVVRDGNGHIRKLVNIRRISPEGSANTCGWFHPTEPDVIIFATTMGAPSESTPPGYQRASGRYRWMFPPEMRIVKTTLDAADGTTDSLEVLVEASAYAAEGSLSSDGRHLLYCSLESGDGDLYVKDLVTGRETRIVGKAGYDGGPFFSPDGRRICYRSDRRGDNLLQIYVADLATDGKGPITGIEREYQLTDNEHVNWCPFWTPDGRALVYATSQMGHSNYEVYMVDADPGDLPGSSGSIKYGTRLRRVTHASGADVLPAFSHDGSIMIWTSQRDESQTSQLWAASFTMPEGPPILAQDEPETDGEGPQIDGITAEDPETGLIYIYDLSDHSLSVYDPDTHEVREVTDPDERAKASALFNRG